MSCGSRCGCSSVPQRKQVLKPRESGCGCGTRTYYHTYESYGCGGPARQVSSPRYGCGTGGGCGCAPSGNSRTLPAESKYRGCGPSGNSRTLSAESKYCGCGPSGNSRTLPAEVKYRGCGCGPSSCGPRATSKTSTPQKISVTPTSAKKSDFSKLWLK